MKKAGVALALLLALPACSKLEHHASKSHAKHEHYATYVNKDFHFSIETSRKASTEHISSATPDGLIKTQVVNFDAPQKPGKFAVWVTPMPFADSHKYTLKRIFDFAVRERLDPISGRISHQQKVTINGVPGREIEATGINTEYAGGMRVSVLIRMFYRDATLYQVMAVYPTSASGMSTEAKHTVRSFKPIALPKLSRGVGEVSGFTCSPEFIRFHHKPNIDMNPKFTVKLEKHLKPGDEVRIQAWCPVRNKYAKDADFIAGDSYELEKKDMDELRRRGKLQTTAVIWLSYAYDAPDVCQWSFRVRSGDEDRASLGDFCWTDAKVTKGRCGM